MPFSSYYIREHMISAFIIGDVDLGYLVNIEESFTV